MNLSVTAFNAVMVRYGTIASKARRSWQPTRFLDEEGVPALQPFPISMGAENTWIKRQSPRGQMGTCRISHPLHGSERRSIPSVSMTAETRNPRWFLPSKGHPRFQPRLESHASFTVLLLLRDLVAPVAPPLFMNALIRPKDAICSPGDRWEFCPYAM